MHVYSQLYLFVGSHRVFGVFLEKNIVILIDLSGSMNYLKKRLDEELTKLLWEQIYKSSRRFTIIGFATDLTYWQKELVDATEQNCKAAMEWFQTQECKGFTCTLKALQVSSSFF